MPRNAAFKTNIALARVHGATGAIPSLSRVGRTMSSSPLGAVLAASLAFATAAHAAPAPADEGRDVWHLPIVRTTRHAGRALGRRAAHSAIGLGDYFDVTYSVMVQVGPVLTPLVLDTGSSDLWAISDACVNCTDGSIPLFPAASLQSAGIDVSLKYGDSSTRTHAIGPIGTSSMGVAKLKMDGQYFAAIDDTNTTIAATGSAGIFGLGFPIASVVFADVFKQRFVTCSDCTAPTKRNQHAVHTATGRRPFPQLGSIMRSARSFVAARAPGEPSVGDLLSLVPVASPLIPRAVNQRLLPEPLVTITLQRETIDPGGNLGTLTLGGLPETVDRDQITWADVRRYNATEVGLPSSISEANSYPLAWEIPLDDVYLDGERLPRTTLTDPRISISALIDTGNSLIRGPADVVDLITRRITSPGSPAGTAPSEVFDCTPHTLAFGIGGKIFPVDPRDFVSQASANVVGVAEEAAATACNLNLAVTDPPVVGDGFLYTWSLGAPFLKSVLAAFHYGNITHPNVDKPRIGLLSTVPQNASALLDLAIKKAGSSDGNFPALSQSAPTDTYKPIGTGVAGVPQAATSIGSAFHQPTRRPHNHASQRTPSTALQIVLCLLAALFWL